MYIIHLVLMRLIGLVTFPPVNYGSSQRERMALLRCCCPPPAVTVPCVCRVQILQVSRDLFIPKHYNVDLSIDIIWRWPSFDMLLFPKTSLAWFDFRARGSFRRDRRHRLYICELPFGLFCTAKILYMPR